MQTPDSQVRRLDHDGKSSLLRLEGRLEFRAAGGIVDRVRRLIPPGTSRVEIDLAGVEALDGGSAALLLGLRRELVQRGTLLEFRGAQGVVDQVLNLYMDPGNVSQPHVAPAPPGFLEQVGVVSADIGNKLGGLLGFIGDIVAEGRQALRRPRSVRWADFVRLLVRGGVDALPIVILINFLVGLVTGFQAAVQLKQFGADIFVADLVGLSITRELAPLMTAIILAGRTGAAYAAEIGTMQVSEEIDALQTLGLDRYRFLVFPRVLALVCVAPVLTLVADAVGALGGLFVGVLGLHLSVASYLTETRTTVDLVDIFGGMVKSVFFAGAIALIACQRGLATRGGAEGVGRSTTSAVVMILFALILLDVGFTVFFQVFGI